MRDILTVAPTQFPGVITHLENLSRTTELSEHTSILSKEKLGDHKLVIFGAWENTYYLAMKKLQQKYQDVKVGLLWTSTVGQMGFSPDIVEGSYLWLIHDAMKAGRLDYLFVPTKRIYQTFQQIFPSGMVKYLPNTVSFEWLYEHQDNSLVRGIDYVDLFLPQASRKNVLNQVMGARLANVFLHFNSVFKTVRDFADLIKLRYCDMGWMDREHYLRALQTMKLGLQVTYAETFDYVLAEHFAYGVPCITSFTIDFLPKTEEWSPLLVENFDDPNEIAQKIKVLIDNEELYSDISLKCVDLISRVAKENNEVCLGTLKGIIE